MNDSRKIVRLFPLPNVVLFPRAILPLHIFEERYKQMVADAIGSDGQIALALLQNGWEREYYARPAIEPVVCVGRILNYEQLPDGKYNLLLQGQYRATVAKEICGKPYRQAHAIPIMETRVVELDLSCERWRLQEIFLQADLGPVGKQYCELLASGLKTAEVADLLAYNLFDNAELKQSLLAEADVAARVRRIMDYLQTNIPMIRQPLPAASAAMN